MLFSLPLSLILATCAVARTTPQLQSGLEKRDTYDLCAEDATCNPGCWNNSIDQNDCQNIAKIVAGNGNPITLDNEGSWSYTSGSCKVTFVNFLSGPVSLCADVFATKIEAVNVNCDGGGGACIVQKDEASAWEVRIDHS